MTAAATRPAYRTITEIKAANRAAGDHFFDRAQLRLFGTRIVTHVLAGSWFITADHLVPAEAPDFTIHRAKHDRSEEHTSELQSRQYLVCRLLLEKKHDNSRNTATLHTTPQRPIITVHQLLD